MKGNTERFDDLDVCASDFEPAGLKAEVARLTARLEEEVATVNRVRNANTVVLDEWRRAHPDWDVKVTPSHQDLMRWLLARLEATEAVVEAANGVANLYRYLYRPSPGATLKDDPIDQCIAAVDALTALDEESS